MIEYGVEEVNLESEVVNPSYKGLTYRIKKMREKLAGLKAKLFAKIEDDLISDIDSVKLELEQQSQLQESISTFQKDIQQLREEQKRTPTHVKIKEMPAESRYNKLKSESKLFMNTIRMIVYRAETAVTNLLAPHYARPTEEIRMLVKEIMRNDADLLPDHQTKTLTMRLHSLSTPRANYAAKELCATLNET